MLLVYRRISYPRARFVAPIFGLAWALVACAGQNSVQGEGQAPDSPPHKNDSAQRLAAPPKTSRAEPTPSQPEFMDLEVPGFEPVLVVAPGDGERHPVLFAAHGAGGHAQAMCGYFLQLLEKPHIIVCPRGSRIQKGAPGNGYFYATHLALEKEVLAIQGVIQALPSALPPPWAYGGYSQGATMGALMLTGHGDIFNRLLLIEGGTEGWTSSRSRHFAAAGGKRVLFACGTRSCSQDAESAAEVMRAVGLDVRVRFAEGAGHSYGGAVQERVASELNWFFR